MASFATAPAYEDVGFTFSQLWNKLCTCELLHPDVRALLSDVRVDAAETQLTLLHDQIGDEDHILTPYGRVTLVTVAIMQHVFGNNIFIGTACDGRWTPVARYKAVVEQARGWKPPAASGHMLCEEAQRIDLDDIAIRLRSRSRSALLFARMIWLCLWGWRVARMYSV